MDDEAARQRAVSLEALRAMTHVTRLRMCAVLAGGPASAAELARRLDLQHAAASYHLRVLRDAGLVALADERTVNGGIERRYRVVAPPEEPVGEEPSTTEDWIALVATVGALQQQRAARVSTDPKWFDDLEVWVRPEVMTEARHLLDAAFAHLRQAAVDPSVAGATAISASALLFAMRTPSGPAAEGGHGG